MHCKNDAGKFTSATAAKDKMQPIRENVAPKCLYLKFFPL